MRWPFLYCPVEVMWTTIKKGFCSFSLAIQKHREEALFAREQYVIQWDFMKSLNHNRSDHYMKSIRLEETCFLQLNRAFFAILQQHRYTSLSSLCVESYTNKTISMLWEEGRSIKLKTKCMRKKIHCNIMTWVVLRN